MIQKWSKQKKQLTNFMCESLKNRVVFQVTSYRKAHDQMGRVYVMIDKKNALSMCSLKTMSETYIRQKNLWASGKEQNIEQIQELAIAQANDAGYFSKYHFWYALEEYFSNSIDQTLSSPDPIVRTLGMLDKRTGKRRLLKMKQQIQDEHDIVKYFYQLRIKAEGLN
ncbi:hypothetical protein PJ311_13830 [Bacillus sp. CLL-7-23]|uniref:Uncharacterized protein n=1 Tax=Bacillus changyiensis TaxID=3004103 RepID=A0ABT4X5U5_9BACI|nr:hypothetical protein [Bacillus changyiensis]MDA7027662.1 hypothetical protein [Bacillus changyiensis]